MKIKVNHHEFVFADDRPFQSCHASTLVVLPDGEVLCAWFGGTREKASDVAIWFSRRTAEGWLPPVKIADEGYIAHWNPVLFRTGAGKLFLFYKVGHEIPQWFTRVMTSEDAGRSWTAPVELVAGDIGGRGPVKNNPVELADGTILAPASLETVTAWDAFVDISTDQGATWQQSRFVPLARPDFAGKGVIQPTLWEAAPGRISMLLRSTAGAVYRSDSTDRGRSWSEAYPTGLPNNNSGLDLVQFASNWLALVYNPVAGDWAARTPLVISFSFDNGQTWGNDFVLEDGPGEYSYPAIVAHDRELWLTYTWRRERIAYWQLSVEV